MQLLIEFDVFADLIDVPDFVIEQKDTLRNSFLNWMYNPKVKHKYWVTCKDKDGVKYRTLRYRSDAFIEWLNKKVLKGNLQRAVLIEENVTNWPSEQFSSIPSIFF